jgi:formate dehydrogenase major subunit
VEVSRRQFFKLTGASLLGSTLTALGFSAEEVMAEVREFKLTHASEVRNTCPYCSVACGIIMYSLGDRAANARPSIFHIEGDPDHPVSRGSLCPKGAGLLDFVHSPSRLLYPQYRGPGDKEFRRVSWDWALDRVARLVKDERDRSFIIRNGQGQTVNRLESIAFLAASASTNEAGYATYKVVRALGIVGFDNQARF